MPEPWLWVLVTAVSVVIIVAIMWRPLRLAAREARLAQARKDFHRQRERLEAKFVKLASARAKHEAAGWADCDFDDSVSYVRHRLTGELSAFVGVTVALERIGETSTSATNLMNSLREGTAVFRFDGQRWETDGRVLLNLSPREAIRRYQHDLEMVGQELASRPL